MDAARQVVRWSIPGWIFLFILTILQLLTELLSGKSLQGILGDPFLDNISTAIAALVVASGIPLGFLIYQVYYSWYNRVLVFYLVNRDRGGDILKTLPTRVRDRLMFDQAMPLDLEDMYDEVKTIVMPYPLRRLRRQFRNVGGRFRYENRLQANWDIIRFWLNYVCIRDKNDLLKHEVTTLADIYHGIGATRTALFGACLLHLAVNLLLRDPGDLFSLRVMFAILGPYVAALWLLRVLERTRTHTLQSLMSMVRHALHFLFPVEEKMELDQDKMTEH